MPYLKILITSFIFLSNSDTDATAADMNRIGEHAVVAQRMQADNVTSIGGNVTVEGIVLMDAVAIGGDVIVGRTEKIHRNAVSIGGESLRIRRPLSTVNMLRSITFHVYLPWRTSTWSRMQPHAFVTASAPTFASSEKSTG